MRTTSSLLAVLGTASLVSAEEVIYQGFNYGATFSDGSLKQVEDFEAEFRAAADLDGTDGAFTSARIYTMIQGNTDNQPISAIQAAINTDTSLLLGLWASAGSDAFANELEALRNAIVQFSGKKVAIAGISVGSEDLYRISPTGIANNEFAGAGPDELVKYIAAARELVKGTEFDAPIGHVDTWTAWVNGSNAAVIDAVDWIGVDAYAYFEDTKDNMIDNGGTLFDEAVEATRAAVKGKDIWITETGWPVSGKEFGQAQANVESAKQFWDEVGCGKLFGKVNTWWYTFQDSKPNTPNPSFGVIGADVDGDPVFDLSCPADDDPAPSSGPSSPSGSPTPNGGGSNTSFASPTPTPTTTPGGGPGAEASSVPAAAPTVMGSMTALLGAAALAVMFAAGLA